MAKRELNLIQLGAASESELGESAPEIVGCDRLRRIPRHGAQNALRAQTLPITTSPLFTPRNTRPVVRPTAADQLSIVVFVHAGMGTVR